jgi:hypothetical protein
MLLPLSQSPQNRFRHLKQRKSNADTVFEQLGFAQISSDFPSFLATPFETLFQKFESNFLELSLDCFVICEGESIT